MAGASALALVISAGSVAQARPIGAQATSASATAAAMALSSAEQAAAIANNAQNSMLRATKALQALQALQGAARNLAISGPNNLGADPNHSGLQLPNVPDGLNVGGLVPSSGLAGSGVANPVTNWVNANTPTQTTSGGQTLVSIQQTAPQAVLNWTTFNIGRNTTLRFDQAGNAAWVALNKISDPSGVPSQIMGRIQADGQVLLINQNGIIFGGTSQINVNTLIATSRDLSALSANNYQVFLSNGLFSSAVPATFSGTNAAIFNTGVTGVGAVTVQPGAIINAGANSSNGGYVALIGSKVTNAGTITTQNGDIILAADNQVDLITPTSSAVGVATAMQVLAGGGVVTNSGLLVSNDGAVALAGGAINQSGGIVVSTSVTRPGSISLSTVCPTGLNCATGAGGNIVLAAGSLTTILPDESGGTVPTSSVNNQSFAANGTTGPYFQQVLQPQINIKASGSIDLQGSQAGLDGAQIKAPSAALTVTAGALGTVLLESGSSIDLSGLAGVTLPMSSNEVSILITANEVADYPLGQNLIGSTVTIDARLSGTRADGLAWVGSPLLDAAGYVGLIPQSIDEVLTRGGSFNVTAAGGGVIQQTGSTVNVSGGYVNYTGGFMSTTRLIGADGRIYNIGSADPTKPYAILTGFTVDHSRWNVTDVYGNPLLASGNYENGYIAGASAGSVGITAAWPILEGQIVGDIVIGQEQAAAAIGGGTTAQTSFAALPVGASLNLTYNVTSPTPNIVVTTVLAPSSDFSSDPYGLASYTFGSTTWKPTLVGNVFPIFSDLLTQTGYGSISLKTSTNWTSLAPDATLSVLAGGSVSLTEVATIGGQITAHGGKISLTGIDDAAGNPAAPTALTLTSHALLDVSGLWTNDAGNRGDQVQGSAFINGGSVNIAAPTDSIVTTATFNSGTLTDGTNLSGDAIYSVVDATQSIVLQQGSVIDASSGGYVGTNGKLKMANGLPSGVGGSVSLQLYAPAKGAANSGFIGNIAGSTGVLSTNATLNNNSTLQAGTSVTYLPAQIDSTITYFTPTDGVARAGLTMNGAIYAFGLNGGGTFKLQAGSITVDGASNAMASYTSGPQSGEVVLPASFFATQGFGSYNLVSVLGSTIVTANTHVALAEQSYLLPAYAAVAPSGTELRNIASIGSLPASLSQPVSLTLQQDSHITKTTDQFGRQVTGSISIIDGTTLAGLLIDSGATITTGAAAAQQATINLVSTGPLSIAGSISAPGGAINLVENNMNGGSTAAQDIWIGPHAVLDVSGTYVPNPQVTTYRTGAVLNGGTITFVGQDVASTPNALTSVLIEPGAQLLLKGAAADIQLPSGTGNLLGSHFASEIIWSNGGALEFSVPNIYLAGSVDAHGGAAAAAGGDLVVGNFVVPAAIASYLNLVAGSVLGGPGTIVVEAPGTIAANMPAAGLSNPPMTTAALAAIAPSAAGTFIGTDTLNNSGFDSVALSSATSIAFNGSVGISVPGALTLTAGNGQFVLLPSSAGLSPSSSTATGRAIVNLNAGYVSLVGLEGTGSSTPLAFPNLGDGSLNVSAQWIDLERSISVANVANVNLTSAGAIRLLPDNYGNIAGPTSTPQSTFGGALIVPGNLTLTATEVYPVSNTDFLLMSTGTIVGSNTVRIAQSGTASTPLSAGGEILINAQNIVQGGTLWAPLGGLVIGLQSTSQIPSIIDSMLFNSTTFNATIVTPQSVVLAPGSLTSVSAAGLDIPDGYTVDGTTWYQGTPNSSNSNLAPALTAPPAKSISLFGVSVTTAGNIDVSGGGDTYATEFVSGTGGSRNVLTTYEQSLNGGSFSLQYPDGRQVYALVPTYLAKVAAYDPTFGNYPYYSGQAAIAAGNYLNGIAPGSAITMAGGNGIPAGTYTLLPGMYATLPGAYRVVQMASTASPGSPASLATADGSVLVTGTITNALTGARSALPALFEVQSQAVWSKYSEINITSGTQFFRNQALVAGTAVPPLPIDGGILALAAVSSLQLHSSNDFAPGTSDLGPGLTGAGGQANIAVNNVLVLASDRTAPAADAGYLVLDADQLSALGATTLVIGGSATFGSSGETLGVTTTNLEIETDAAHPLTAPELILVTKAGGANGLTLDAGSVVRAAGSVPQGTDRSITIGSGTAATASGSLLRVSNGSQIQITRPGAAATGANIAIGTAPGTTNLAAGAGVLIDGGSALTIDTSGNGTLALDQTAPDGSVLAAGVTLSAQSYTLSANLISIGGGTSGLELSQSLIANLAGASAVTLRSASRIDLYDTSGLTIGDIDHPINTLTFDGAGLYSQGGTTTINAINVILTDTQATATAPSGPTGTLFINAGVSGSTVFGSGTLMLGATPVPSAGAGFLFANFASVNLAASQAIEFSGTGAFGSGAAAVKFSAPEVLVGTGAVQSFTTSGIVSIAPGAGVGSGDAVNAANLGGSLTMSAGGIIDSGLISARAGKLVLTTTSGNIELSNGASIDARGAVVQVLDQVEFAPGGIVQLTATSTAAGDGNVSVGAGSSIDVSAIGIGRAGSLAITAGNVATLAGNLQGGAAALLDQNGNVVVPAFKDMGGNFALNAGSLAAGSLLPRSFTGSISVTLQTGDIKIGTDSDALAPALSAGQISLTATSGEVVISGTNDPASPSDRLRILDANGRDGQISLYGANGVSINSGVLVTAAYVGDDPRDPNYANGASVLVQNGGTITLGTSGTPSSGYNAAWGYENVDTSGMINVASNAALDVSGGPGGANISNNGGAIILRAPLLTTGNVNVSFRGNVIMSGNGGPAGPGVSLDAYAIWSTTDQTTGGQHFDGIIDPAGWFNSDGTMIAGTTSNGDVFTPTGTINSSHVTFYQTTLVDFVQKAFGNGNTTAVQTDFSGLVPGVNLHFRPEIDLVSPASGTGSNGGNITVASNWNLGGVQVAPVANRNAPIPGYKPAYRTLDAASVNGDAGEAGVLTLQAANNVAVNATISDGFYETSAAFGTVATTNYTIVADQIANNPALTSTSGTAVFDLNTTSAASLMPVGMNSFSYDFVAGANLVGGSTPSANPNAVVILSTPVNPTAPTDSFTINGHTAYSDAQGTNPNTGAKLMIDIPSMVRTGTGSIAITSAGNVEFLDTTVPGAIYTAGAAITTPADFTPPPIVAGYFTKPNGLISTPAWATNGGSVMVTAMQSMIGIEDTINLTTNNQTGVTNGQTVQIWSDWYSHAGISNGTLTPFSGTGIQTSAWVNTATFFQQFGALGGGNIVLSAGTDITDISASLPESILVGGGKVLSDPPKLYQYGGGDLIVTAGSNVNSSIFLVGRGSGLIQAGGAVQPDARNPLTGVASTMRYVFNGANGTGTAKGTPIPLSLILGVQDGFISVSALGGVTLGGVYDPTALPTGASVQTQYPIVVGSTTAWGRPFTSYGASSGVDVTSVGGTVNLLTIPSDAFDGLFVTNDLVSIDSVLFSDSNVFNKSLPATIEAAALSGSIAFGLGVSGHPNIITATIPIPDYNGDSTADISLVAAQSIDLGYGLRMQDLKTLSTQFIGAASPDYANYISPLGLPLASLTEALHANDTTPAVIAAGGNILLSGSAVSTPTGQGLQFIKPAEIEAGGSILGMNTILREGNTNINAFPVILQNNNPTDVSVISAGQDIIGGSYTIYGPGDLLISAGRNLGPLFPSINASGNLSTSGIAAIGNGIVAKSALVGNLTLSVVPYLPATSADISVLFGVGPGVNYTGAIAQYVDPAGSGAAVGISFLADIASNLGFGSDTAAAWKAFNSLSTQRQDLLVQRAFLDFLTRAGKDYGDTTSPYYHQYARIYSAIETLFPAAYGYTNNNATSGVNGAANPVQTGKMNIASSVLETELGGDINIIGPGGGLTVGTAARDLLNPAQEGILTLSGGAINVFTDGNIVLNQSRIMTEQGGDINLISANGSILAGEGPKTYASNPPISDVCDVNGYCQVSPSGLVTGAGIAAVLTLPGQDPSKSNVSLIAPHGTVDAGAAGIRVAGNFTVAALQVLNAFNIQVNGTTVGVPVTQGPPVASLTTASNNTAATQQAIAPAKSGEGDAPSVIIVEFLGFGGGDDGDGENDQRRRRLDRTDSQDPSSHVQVLSAGDLSDAQRNRLVEERRRVVNGH